MTCWLYQCTHCCPYDAIAGTVLAARRQVDEVADAADPVLVRREPQQVRDFRSMPHLFWTGKPYRPSIPPCTGASLSMHVKAHPALVQASACTLKHTIACRYSFYPIFFQTVRINLDLGWSFSLLQHLTVLGEKHVSIQLCFTLWPNSSHPIAFSVVQSSPVVFLRALYSSLVKL